MGIFPGIPDVDSPDQNAFWLSFWANVYAGVVYSVFTGLFVGLAVWLVQRWADGRRERRAMEREAATLREKLRFALRQPDVPKPKIPSPRLLSNWSTSWQTSPLTYGANELQTRRRSLN